MPPPVLGLFGMPPIPQLPKTSTDSAVRIEQVGTLGSFAPPKDKLFMVQNSDKDVQSSALTKTDLFGKKSQYSVFGSSTSDTKSGDTFFLKPNETEAFKGPSNIFGASVGGSQKSEVIFKPFNTSETQQSSSNESKMVLTKVFSSDDSPQLTDFVYPKEEAHGESVFKKQTPKPFSFNKSQEGAASEPSKETTNPFLQGSGNSPTAFVFGKSGFGATSASNTFGKAELSNVFGQKSPEAVSSKPQILFGKKFSSEAIKRLDNQDPNTQIFEIETSQQSPFKKATANERGQTENEKRLLSKRFTPTQSTKMSEKDLEPKHSNFSSGAMNLFGKSIDQIKRFTPTTNQELMTG